MGIFSDMCKYYYDSVKAEDEILYPGYHMHLLDDASGTYIYQTRADLMKCLEFHEGYLSAVVKELVAVEFKLTSFMLHPAQIHKLEEEKARLEEEKDMMTEGITGLMESVVDEEITRRNKIAEFLGL